MRNSFALDFFIVINRFNVRLDELSGELFVESFIPEFADGIGEPVPIVNGECGRRQPLDQFGFLIGGLDDSIPMFIGADLVAVKVEGD